MDLTWYNALAKRSWTPTPATIGTIWSILHPIIAVSFLYVMVRTARRRVGWETIVWMIAAAWKPCRWVALAQVPCLIWVSIATVLQLSITRMNRGGA
jgi:tryptophan-rich sensory protein